MLRNPRFLLQLAGATSGALFTLAAALAAPPAAAPAAPPAAAPAATPAARTDPSVASPKADTGTFMKMHESFLKRGKEGPIGVLFLGDSITQGWTKAPAVWEQYYGKLQPANFGIGGDRVEHVLWRIENGELEGIKPKAVVLMIGTNNTGTHKAEEISRGIRKLVGEVRQKLPDSKILLLAVFPRGPRKTPAGAPDDSAKRMEIIHAINADIAKLDDGKMVRFLDINDRFLVNGAIPDDIMPDQLHPNAKGYQIWAEAMQPLLTELVK